MKRVEVEGLLKDACLNRHPKQERLARQLMEAMEQLKDVIAYGMENKARALLAEWDAK